jgi:hypothetical protein
MTTRKALSVLLRIVRLLGTARARIDAPAV